MSASNPKTSNPQLKPETMQLLLSIIIPARNEEHNLPETIESITSALQKNITGYELLVVDNESTDQTARVAAALGAQTLDAKHAPSVAAVRNFGAQQSSGKILCFIDADIIVSDRWGETVARMAQEWQDDSRTISGAAVDVASEQNWVSRCWFSSPNRDRSYINSGNLVITRTFFDLLGGFNENLGSGEDYDLCTRGRQQGGNVTPNPLLSVKHARIPDSLTSFWLREFWHGMGDFQSWATFRTSKIAWACSIILLTTFLAVAGAIITKSVFPLLIPLFFLFLTAIASALRRPRNRRSELIPVTFLYCLFYSARALSPFAILLGARGDVWRKHHRK